MRAFDHKAIEEKWQERWREKKSFSAKKSSKEKSYLLIEFPYPSGAGLHVGHVRSFTAMDVVARKRRREGKEVLYPIGWDAFGLPTENYAIKTGRNPKDITKENTDTFRRQLKALGLSFDWDREVNTTDPSYYKWTQWIFLKLFEKGLAYKAEIPINWCPNDKIGLANEEVVEGKCERCGTEVEKRKKEQWMLRITEYAQRLYDDLETVDYIERAKVQQKNWIGPSEGALIDFKIVGSEKMIRVFTTRPDTLFGATYMVLSPEHPLINKISEKIQNMREVEAYVSESAKKTEFERNNIEKEKTGVKLKGVLAINPANKEEIPIYIADYVMMGYGTGAIMAVPAHDERDNLFAKKFDIPIRAVVLPSYVGGCVRTWMTSNSYRNEDDVLQVIAEKVTKGESVYVGSGILTSSTTFNGTDSEDAKKRITEAVGGTWKTTYKLRDWVFSRQRYWGEPIPVVSCPKCGLVPVPESELPVELPHVEKYEPTDSGESPLATIEEWVNTTCPKCAGPAKRETDTMPNWAGSSWYYLRYCDPHNDKRLASKEALEYWTPVDWYNGGMEHTVLHLLYSRFWHKFLFDIGVVPTSEPYQKRTSHGIILASDGEKMSKSRGNVINPDDITLRFGADALRVYEMFMGPFDQAIAWSENGLVGARRFLERIVDLHEKVADVPLTDNLEYLTHKTVEKVSSDIEELKMNTAVATLMEYSNELGKSEQVPKEGYRILLLLLAPFAPHLTAELWENLGENTEIHEALWPSYDQDKLIKKTVTIGIQVDGKIRGEVTLPTSVSDAEAFEKALQDGNVQKWIKGEIIKKIYVPGRIISFLTKS